MTNSQNPRGREEIDHALPHERLYVDEQAAHAARRQLINKGMRVSLIAYDPSRDRYVFDA
jgi:hypothetical protein